MQGNILKLWLAWLKWLLNTSYVYNYAIIDCIVFSAFVAIVGHDGIILSVKGYNSE